MSAPDRIVFRMPLKWEGCEAFIMDAPANPGFILHYAHLGQHGEASREYYRDSTRPATPAEYAALARELRGQGYDVRPMKRLQRGGAK